MDNPNEDNTDVTDEGIFMKMHQNTESVTSLYAPVPMTPTQTNSRGFISTKTPPTPESPNYSFANKLKVQSDMKRITSTGNIQSRDEKEAKVLVLYTGGTIGMLRNDKNGEYSFK